MIDEELVKRLVDWSEHDEGKINDARQEAADRIEALTAENARLERVVEDLSDEVDLAEQEASMVEDDFVKAEKEIEALTAKLAKAVEALREIASEASVTVHTHNRGGINYTRMYKDWRELAVKRIDKARDTLAEIEGDKE